MPKLPPHKFKKILAVAQSAQKGGKTTQAEKAYRDLITSRPDMPELHVNLAKVLAAQNKIPDAAASFETALKLCPDHAGIWAAYLDLAAGMGHEKNLGILLKRSRDAMGDVPLQHFFTGMLEVVRKNHRAAATAFEASIEADYRVASARWRLANALEMAGDNTGALEQLDKLIENAPDDEVLSRRAGLLRDLGDTDAARRSAKDAIKHSPDVGIHYYNYATSGRIEPNDPVLPVIKGRFQKLGKTNMQRAFLGFSIAKAMEDLDEQHGYFEILKAANAPLKEFYPYNFLADLNQAKAVREAYEKNETIKPVTDGPTPIFITGLPRSGTTLVETILAAHSQVSQGGELAVLAKPVFQAITQKDSGAALTQTATQFQSYAAGNFQTPYFTDKSISTYAYLGLAVRMFPNAKFLLVRRDPREIAFSMYKNFFQPGQHRYSTSLETIAQFMNMFDGLIAHWKSLISNAFVEIHYDEIVSAPDEQTKALVAAAGLEWEEECLSFFKRAGKIKTLSSMQVRQPLHKKSLGAWKEYEAEMRPFIDAYDGPLPD